MTAPHAEDDRHDGRAFGGAERAVLLALADDEHLIGQRHTEWIGVAPFLEEDLAFSSIAQDELGHAVALYGLLTDDVDALAFGRSPEEYRTCWLVEAPCTEWAEALVRHWCYDTAEELRWQQLQRSSDHSLRSIAERALVEESYHRRHADALLDALLPDAEAGARVRAALTAMLPLADAQFEPVEETWDADRAVVGAPLDDLRDQWRELVDRRFGHVDWSSLSRPEQHGRTRRSDAFAAVYERMREVVSLDPAAKW